MKKLLVLLIVLVGCGDVNFKSIVVGREFVIPSDKDAILSEEESLILKDICGSLAIKAINFKNSSRIFNFKTNLKKCDDSEVEEMAILKIQSVNNEVRFVPDSENEAVNYFAEFETDTQGALRFLCNQTSNPSINVVETLTSQLKRVYRINPSNCRGTNQKTCFEIATVLKRDQDKDKFYTIKHERLKIDSNSTASTAANKGIVLERVREEECIDPQKTIKLTSELDNN